jgi:hypothetical protein
MQDLGLLVPPNRHVVIPQLCAEVERHRIERLHQHVGIRLNPVKRDEQAVDNRERPVGAANRSIAHVFECCGIPHANSPRSVERADDSCRVEQSFIAAQTPFGADQRSEKRAVRHIDYAREVVVGIRTASDEDSSLGNGNPPSFQDLRGKWNAPPKSHSNWIENVDGVLVDDHHPTVAAVDR